MKQLIIIYLLLTSCQALAQREVGTLPKSLNELSGLEQLNDSVLVGHNDGGDGANLYLMSLEGKLLKKVEIVNAKNKDWEDITRDETHLYIGDIGNNQNKRRELKIYKVPIKSVLEQTKVRAEVIYIAYAEQKQHPPLSKSDYNFDAEVLVHRKGELWVFTKPNTDPWHGQTWVYRFPTKPGSYKKELSYQIDIGKGGWWTDALTAGDYLDDQTGETFFLSTYNRIITFNFAENELILDDVIHYSSLSQKEALVVVNRDEIIVGDEVQSFLGGGKLYRFKNIHGAKQ